MTATPAQQDGLLPYPAAATRSNRRPLRSAVLKAGFSPFGGNARWDVLTQRARTTNLAVLLLAGTACISLLLNVRMWLGNEVFRRPEDYRERVPLSIRATLQSPHASLRHLVMVPGHAIWQGCDASHATEDKDWILEPMQRGGSVRTYLKHIAKGAEVAVRDPEALLIYSGGQTRPNSDLTEGLSYARLAKLGNIYEQFMDEEQRHKNAGEFERVTTEDFAMDSMENVLFSIARFKEFTGHYPTYITVVGYGMKRRRYEDVHRAAVRWPASAFKYIGIDNEGDVQGDYEGERKYGLEPFLRDMYGCHGSLLAKRRKRNPYRRFHAYHSSAPELARLLEYCPSHNTLFPGSLPWD
ncbi:hypothetical protein RTBOTA2_005060 [Rhodotorula toruloides]|uniref:Uncharacterized protein n=1 Tax=Rhodotorula toruloides TaxID=5286 RepID=A0A0K3CG27_RHOTO|nr:hypothetical protein RTBOTA2_005060 [Rhodotorula toruloides]PRQ74407.1 hypothetical protein AAT19DRAFT_14760 [Rhodotorula toruloides]